MFAMRAAKGCVIHSMCFICACCNAVDTHTKSCDRVGICLWPAVLPDREYLRELDCLCCGQLMPITLCVCWWSVLVADRRTYLVRMPLLGCQSACFVHGLQEFTDVSLSEHPFVKLNGLLSG